MQRSISSDLAVGERANGETFYYSDSYNGFKTANGEIFDTASQTWVYCESY